MTVRNSLTANISQQYHDELLNVRDVPRRSEMFRDENAYRTLYKNNDISVAIIKHYIHPSCVLDLQESYASSFNLNML